MSSEIKIRVELNKGRIGMPLGKLARIADETLKFLAMLSSDLELNGDPKEWLATDFDNNSVDFTLTKSAPQEEVKARRAIRALNQIMSDRPNDVIAEVEIRAATWLQYTRIAEPIDTDELVKFGVWEPQEAEKEPARHEFVLTKPIAQKIARRIPVETRYFGQVQGRVHSLYKESSPPKVVLRDVVTGTLVDCFYRSDMYGDVVAALKDKDGTVIVEGWVTENLITGEVERIGAEALILGSRFNLNFYRSFLESRPSTPASEESVA